MRRLFVLFVVLLPLLMPAPASAKGPTSVTVTGPGIDFRVLDYRRSPTELGTLSSATGIHGIFGGGQFVARPDLSQAELGPRYVLHWDAGEPLAISHVYPFAEGGAWAVVPRGQAPWGRTLPGGWWRGGLDLERAMIDLGATPPPKTLGPVTSTGSAAETASAPPSPAPVEAATSTVDLAERVWVAALAGMALLIGGATWLGRRRTPARLLTKPD